MGCPIQLELEDGAPEAKHFSGAVVCGGRRTWRLAGGVGAGGSGGANGGEDGRRWAAVAAGLGSGRCLAGRGGGVSLCGSAGSVRRCGAEWSWKIFAEADESSGEVIGGRAAMCVELQFGGSNSCMGRAGGELSAGGGGIRCLRYSES